MKHVYVLELPCKLFSGNLNGRGYGHGWSKIQKRNVGAHVKAWEEAYGTSPERGICVCHKCDVRNCIEPTHLFLGTHSENSQDMSDKGRNVGARPENRPRGSVHGARVAAKAVRGVKHHRAKLDDDKVRWIRTRPMSDLKMADQLGVSVPTVNYARIGKTWSHVK